MGGGGVNRAMRGEWEGEEFGRPADTEVGNGDGFSRISCKSSDACSIPCAQQLFGSPFSKLS